MNFWSIIFYFLIIYDFAKNNTFEYLMGPLATVYIGILAIYAGDKEFTRWHQANHNGKHPGELFIIAWTILVFSILFLCFIFSKPYKLPDEVTSAYIAALTILAITRRSKILYKKKRRV